MAKIFRNPLTIIQGTGVTVVPNNTPIQGKTSPSDQISISIGNDVSTDGSVIFGTLTSTSRQFTINNFVLSNGGISGSISLLGNTIIQNNLFTSQSMSVNTLTTEKIESELSQSMTIFESGSSIFGDTVDDTHYFTGSFLTSGSISLDNHSVSSVSNDTSLTDGSSTDLVTENAVKAYLDANDDDTIPAYFRKCFAHTGSFVSSTTSSFTAVTASAPTGFTSTSENDFMFFINGQLMEHDGISVQQNGSSLAVHIDGDSIGYDLTNDDEVVAWGKFNS